MSLETFTRRRAVQVVAGFGATLCALPVIALALPFIVAWLIATSCDDDDDTPGAGFLDCEDEIEGGETVAGEEVVE